MQVKTLILLLLLVKAPIHPLTGPSAGGVALEISTLSAPPGAAVCFDIKAVRFESVIGMQYSLHWDPEVIAYQGVAHFRLPGLGRQNFGEHLQKEGVLTFSWLDLNLQGVTMPPGSSLFQVCFEVSGAAGQQSLLSFVEHPTPIELVDVTEKVVPFTGSPGRLTVE